MSRFLIVALVGALGTIALGCEIGPPMDDTAAVDQNGQPLGHQQGALNQGERPRVTGGATPHSGKSVPGMAGQPGSGAAGEATGDEGESAGSTGGAIDVRCTSTGSCVNHGVPQPLDPGPAPGQ